MFRPCSQPNSRNVSVKTLSPARTSGSLSATAIKMPIRRILPCCWPKLASGHNAAELPMPAISSRRLIHDLVGVAQPDRIPEHECAAGLLFECGSNRREANINDREDR